MKFFLKFLRFSLISLFTGFTLGVILLAGAYLYLAPELPEIAILKDVQLQTPLRVYSRDGALIAEFGEKKRTPLKYAEFPDLMRKAVLAAEDDRFYEHPGVDYQGILRAVVHLLKTGEKGQGGSTITMQVARNFFLSREKTYLRKLSEIFLALKIERELSKEEILELYLNKIYLGHRSYGFAAAAQVYYGKNINELRPEQMAMLAGLPKAPSTNNPVTNPRRALTRRNYILDRMHDLDYIDEVAWQQARERLDDARLHGLSLELEAPYVAEMVRARLVQDYGTDAYASGYRVYTTLDTRLQRFANSALKTTLLDYDRRHGWRGPEGRLPLEPELLRALPAEQSTRTVARGEPKLPTVPQVAPGLLEALRIPLLEFSEVGGLEAAVVLDTGERSLLVMRSNGELLQIGWDVLDWARTYINENNRGPQPDTAGSIAQRGDVVRLERRDDKWWLAQLPAVEGAIVSLSPENGAIRALVGGFDFYQSKFNRVTQAERQPGSNFKPFVYSAALENGFTAASIINDAPVVFEDKGLEDTWRPENYSGKFFGPTRLREALINSRNLVSIRLLRSIGINTAIEYAKRFGFNTDKLPRDLSLALGSGALPALDLVRGYAVFANGGYLVDPYFIDRIEDSNGNVLFTSNPAVVCRDCEQPLPADVTVETKETMAASPQSASTDIPVDTGAAPATAVIEPRIAPRVISEQNTYIMRTLMRDVVRYGTGRRALQLGRNDLAGKTGTTNDQKDAWFSGFGSNLVTTTWVGFDKHQPLGAIETGARAALPMWVDYMGNALKGVPELPYEQPTGLVTVRIDPATGMLAENGQKDAIFEIFIEGSEPKRHATSPQIPGGETPGPASSGISEQLF